MVITVIVFYKFNLTFVWLIHEVTSALVVTEQTEVEVSYIKKNVVHLKAEELFSGQSKAVFEASFTRLPTQYS